LNEPAARLLTCGSRLISSTGKCHERSFCTIHRGTRYLRLFPEHQHVALRKLRRTKQISSDHQDVSAPALRRVVWCSPIRKTRKTTTCSSAVINHPLALPYPSRGQHIKARPSACRASPCEFPIGVRSRCSVQGNELPAAERGTHTSVNRGKNESEQNSY
jgi:hypothetical protein